MRGDLRYRVLKAIAESTWATAKDLAEDLLLYSAAGQGNRAAKFALKRKRERQYYDALDRERLMETIRKLKKEGAVTLSDQGLVLTDVGMRKKEKLEASQVLKLTKDGYPRDRVGGKKFIIVFFDIKEKDRLLRNWLRNALKNLGYHILQESVMVGKVKIPMEFIEELKRRSILHRVHILVVEESLTGTLEEESVVRMLDQISQ